MSTEKFDLSKSLYIQIKDIIRDKIQSGEYKPGSKIPSEKEFCDKYDVSRITIRNALSEAIKEGLLFTVQGKGTFVRSEADRKITQKLVQVDSFENTIKSMGMTASTLLLGYEMHMNHKAYTQVLSLSPDQKVFQLNLLGSADGQPFVLYQSFFKEELGRFMLQQALEKEKRGAAFSTLDLYQHSPLVQQPASLDQTLEAISADSLLAPVLKVKKGAPLFLISSILFSSDNMPLEYKQAYYRSDKYKFHLSRKLL